MCLSAYVTDTPIATIWRCGKYTEKDVQQFVIDKCTSGLARKTVRDIVAVLKSVIKYGNKRALFCESHKQFVEAKRAFVKALIIAPYLLETDIYAKLEEHNYCYWIEIVENVVKILSVRKGDPINMAKLGSVLLSVSYTHL